MRWLDKLKNGLKKTAGILSFNCVNTDELEESLILSDMGVEMAMALSDLIRARHPKDVTEMRSILREELIKKIMPVSVPLKLRSAGPTVILMVGVNGAGKTTTIGKLAAQ